MANAVHLLARARPDSCVFTWYFSQQKYCVALSEKSWCGSSVCDEYALLVLAKWLGFHLTTVEGMDQSALLEALISRFRLQWLCTSYL